MENKIEEFQEKLNYSQILLFAKQGSDLIQKFASPVSAIFPFPEINIYYMRPFTGWLLRRLTKK